MRSPPSKVREGISRVSECRLSLPCPEPKGTSIATSPLLGTSRPDSQTQCCGLEQLGRLAVIEAAREVVFLETPGKKKKNRHVFSEY